MSRSRASGSSARPIGTFSQKIHSQEMCSVSAPPISGPLATATPVTAPKTPRPPPAALGRHGVADRVSVSGIMIAARALDRPERDELLDARERAAAPRRRP